MRNNDGKTVNSDSSLSMVASVLVASNRAAFEQEHRLFSTARNVQDRARGPLDLLVVFAALPDQELAIGGAEICPLRRKAIAQCIEWALAYNMENLGLV